MRILTFLIISLLLTSKSYAKEDPKELNVQITQSLKGHRWGKIYFSAQPSMEDFKALKEQGFASVINLRSAQEDEYKESEERLTVKSAGLNYHHVPFEKKASLSDELIQSITSQVVESRKQGKVLVHCSSGNRVALWLGGHFKKDHKFSPQKSLQLAKELGLTKGKAEIKLKKYLNID